MRKKPRRRLWPVAAIAAVLAFGTVLMLTMVVGTRGHHTNDAPRCGDGPTTDGIDVSYYQDTIDWSRVHRAGIRFAFIRVSDGTTVEDPMFAANWTAAKRVRMARGAYQFFRPDQSATAQADLLISAIARDPGELPPVIDVEATGGKSPAHLAKAIRTWVERVRARAHVEPIVYTSPDFWRDEVGGADLSSQRLWVAHYTNECPRVPAPWTRWTFWQHSKTGEVPGITGPVDLDVLSGTLDSSPR